MGAQVAALPLARRARTNRFYFPSNFDPARRQTAAGCFVHAHWPRLLLRYARKSSALCASGSSSIPHPATPGLPIERRWPGLRFPMILQRHYAVQRRTQRQQRQTLSSNCTYTRLDRIFLLLATISDPRSTVRLQLWLPPLFASVRIR